MPKITIAGRLLDDPCYQDIAIENDVKLPACTFTILPIGYTSPLQGRAYGDVADLMKEIDLHKGEWLTAVGSLICARHDPEISRKRYLLIKTLTPFIGESLKVEAEEKAKQSRFMDLLLVPQPEGGYTVTAPGLSGLITEGNTIDEALENAQDALRVVMGFYDIQLPNKSTPLSISIVTQ